jgi:uncharacterized protein YceH (UPF0502 family)
MSFASSLIDHFKNLFDRSDSSAIAASEAALQQEVTTLEERVAALEAKVNPPAPAPAP